MLHRIIQFTRRIYPTESSKTQTLVQLEKLKVRNVKVEVHGKMKTITYLSEQKYFYFRV